MKIDLKKPKDAKLISGKNLNFNQEIWSDGLLKKHSYIDLVVKCFGDVEIDIFKQINLWDWIILMLVPVFYALLGIIVAGVSVLILLRKQS